MKIYLYLADVVISIHLLWILFLVFGAYWGVRHKVVKVMHILGLFSAFVVNLFDIYCPLTILEIWLENKYSTSAGYSGSFITHYVGKLIYIHLPVYIIFLLTAALCVFNAWMYLRPLLFFREKEK